MAKKKRKKGRGRASPKFHLEYYTLPFELIHRGLHATKYSYGPHPIHNSFWSVVPPGLYSSEKGRELLVQYSRILEEELARVLSRQSIAYWLHLYRRLAPNSIGDNQLPGTIGLVRATLEAAIQKYARLECCDGIAWSNSVPEEKILRGMLLDSRLAFIRDALRSQPQLVLTNFGIEELKEFYELEKAAYQIWRCGATMRLLGKGASLVESSPIEFGSAHSDDLELLVRIHDSRAMILNTSATGTVFKTSGDGAVPLPIYNLEHLSSDEFREVFKAHELNFVESFTTNFIWCAFNLREFYAAHCPFEDEFLKQHGVPLSWVIASIGALCFRAFGVWQETKLRIVHYWQRAYAGPIPITQINDDIRHLLPQVSEYLGLNLSADKVDLAQIVSFLGLREAKRKDINVLLGGPHSILLPFSKDSVFIDYAWIHRRLYNLFFGIAPADQRFKGDLLEQLVHDGRSTLPTVPCLALNGEKRQVDAAFGLDDLLVIAECRAVGRSFGVELGNPESIRFRNNKIDTALEDIDEKARWLAANPIGTNYDIRKYRRILPIAVTPFVEYICSLKERYWLESKFPRVVTTAELRDAINDGRLKSFGTSPNCVSITSV